MSEPKLIPMPKQDRAAEIERAAEHLAHLIRALTIEVLRELKAAETEAVARLAQYVPTERPLTLEQAASYVQFSARTVRGWCNANPPLVQYSIIGGELRFRKPWLDEALERRSVKPQKVRL